MELRKKNAAEVEYPGMAQAMSKSEKEMVATDVAHHRDAATIRHHKEVFAAVRDQGISESEKTLDAISASDQKKIKQSGFLGKSEAERTALEHQEAGLVISETQLGVVRNGNAQLDQEIAGVKSGIAKADSESKGLKGRSQVQGLREFKGKLQKTMLDLNEY